MNNLTRIKGSSITYNNVKKEKPSNNGNNIITRTIGIRKKYINMKQNANTNLPKDKNKNGALNNNNKTDKKQDKPESKPNTIKERGKMFENNRKEAIPKPNITQNKNNFSQRNNKNNEPKKTNVSRKESSNLNSQNTSKLNDTNIQKSKIVNKNIKPIINNNNNINKKNMGSLSGKSNQDEELKRENESLKLEVRELRNLVEKRRKESENLNIYNIDVKYDIALKFNLLKELLYGWRIKYGPEYQTKYSKLKNEKLLIIGFLGMKNTGKSFIISKILNENICDKKDTDYLYLRYMTKNESDIKLAILDTPGIGRIIKREDSSHNIIETKENQGFDGNEKDRILTDNFLINFILKKCDFLIVVVDGMNIYEQKLLQTLKMKNKEHKEAFKDVKTIFIIHNLKNLSKKKEVEDHINNVILNSISFKLDEKELQSNKIKKDNNKNTRYFIEKNDDKLLKIYHLILAKDKSEAGNYYNEATFCIITQQFNNNPINTFDLIKELKEEIIKVSDQIFVEPLQSLNDFDDNQNKIKVKGEFEYISNSQENQDFSLLNLKPKYSYYRIDNNSKLLIVIEMPGKIIDKKLVCSAPKNGYYSIKFSGKKVLDYPENIQKEKKGGYYFNNREEGCFKEVFKIKQEDFTLSSYSCLKEENENNGVYKYYFQLMNQTISSDEDN